MLPPQSGRQYESFSTVIWLSISLAYRDLSLDPRVWSVMTWKIVVMLMLPLASRGLSLITP